MLFSFTRGLRSGRRRRISAACLISLLPMALSASCAFAAVSSPKSVVFYPRAAQLTVEERITPQNLPGGGKGMVITLPAHANRQSFSLVLTGGQVSGTVWRDVVVDDAAPQKSEPGKSSPRAALLGELRAARAEKAQIDALVAVSQKRIELLTEAGSQTDKKKGVEEVEKLDGLLNQQLTKLLAELPGQERKAEALERRISKAEQDLATLGGEELREQSVTVTVDGAAGPVTARYSYMLPGCGWTPAYTLEAQPGKNLVLLTQEADLVQNTLIPWDNAEITVATNTPDSRPAPNLLPAWVLQPGRPQVAASPRARENSALAQSDVVRDEKSAELKMMRPMTEPQAPTREEKTTFALWTIGKRSIPAGNQVRVTLAKEQWKADYYYTIRPMLDKKGFLTAAATPAAPVDMPAGPAVFLIDGTVIGASPLALHGDTLKLYFGADPLVTATMRNDQRQSGESGIISKDQTLTWNWSISVNNARNKPVTVQVEDPSPVSKDEAIKLEVTSTPKPELNNQAYTWRIPLQAGETKVITHAVKATAPKETPLSPGR